MSLITIDDALRILQQKLVALAPEICKGESRISELNAISRDISDLHLAQLVLKRIEKEHFASTETGKMIEQLTHDTHPC